MNLSKIIRPPPVRLFIQMRMVIVTGIVAADQQAEGRD